LFNPNDGINYLKIRLLDKKEEIELIDIKSGDIEEGLFYKRFYYLKS
jgi:hypothetical protein